MISVSRQYLTFSSATAATPMTRLLLPTLFSLSRTLIPAPSLLPTLYGGHGCFVHPMSNMLQESVKSSTTGGSAYGVRRLCSSLDDLAAKKCVPCNAKELRPMTEESAKILIQQIAGWDLVNDNGTLKLQRSWTTKSFRKGLEFFGIVGEVAESEGHHPDLHLVGWNNVNIEIWTHAIGGLTENDFILAAKISELRVEELMRIKRNTK